LLISEKSTVAARNVEMSISMESTLSMSAASVE
jgi:hypothetical protein